MIETADQDGIAILTLNHGPVNALDLDLLSAVPGSLAAVSDSRAIVLTGSGRSFSAGVDLKQIIDGGLPYAAKFLPALSVALLAVFEHPKPVVAAINGHALAGGCVLAAACDIRLMSGGTIGLTELAAGVPFPTVPLEIMRHAVGPALDAMVLGAACDSRSGHLNRPRARGRPAGPAAHRGAAAGRRAVRRPTGRLRSRETPAPRARPRAHRHRPAIR